MYLQKMSVMETITKLKQKTHPSYVKSTTPSKCGRFPLTFKVYIYRNIIYKSQRNPPLYRAFFFGATRYSSIPISKELCEGGTLLQGFARHGSESKVSFVTRDVGGWEGLDGVGICDEK